MLRDQLHDVTCFVLVCVRVLYIRWHIYSLVYMNFRLCERGGVGFFDVEGGVATVTVVLDAAVVLVVSLLQGICEFSKIPCGSLGDVVWHVGVVRLK